METIKNNPVLLKDGIMALIAILVAIGAFQLSPEQVEVIQENLMSVILLALLAIPSANAVLSPIVRHLVTPTRKL